MASSSPLAPQPSGWGLVHHQGSVNICEVGEARTASYPQSRPRLVQAQVGANVSLCGSLPSSASPAPGGPEPGLSSAPARSIPRSANLPYRCLANLVSNQTRRREIHF